jgi:xylan 1,4-beta-xylosidase
MTTLSSHAVSTPRVSCGTRTIRLAHTFAAAAIGLLLLADAGAARAATIAVDASKQTSGNPHFWSAAFGTGKAHTALRSDWQTHYKIGNRELGAQRVRGHGLFNDEMNLYKGAASYDWTNLDTYLSAISLANMRPIIETDFMPTALASSSTDAMHSPPKDYKEWKSFITAMVQHCVDKYGKDDVANWYFEIWNEPNYPGFWVNSDMSAYYTLYDNTVAAITAVLPNALVGGPASTDSEPISAFLAHCKSAGTRVTFLSSHNYPGGPANGTAADPANLVSDNDDRIRAITSNGYTTTAVKSFNTEWNSSYSGQGGQTGDAVTSMDNHWNVGFILRAAKLLSDKNSGDTPPLDVFSYWALTDVFDEDGGTDGIHMTSVNGGATPFGQVFGVMTFQGMRKAAFNAFKMLNYTGPKRMQCTGGAAGDGVDAMATMSAASDSLQILVHNYYKTLNTASGSGDSVTINVSNLPTALANQKVYVTRFLVDETHSNPYSVWQSQNKPGTPSETQWQAMRAAQHLALAEPVSQTSVTTSFTTTFSLTKQAGTLVIVSLKRPLTGRDALVEIEGEDYDGQSGATKEDSGDSSTLGQSISIGSSGGNVYFENVDYTDDGVNTVQLRVKTASDTSMELHAVDKSGTDTSLGKCAVSSTSDAWATQTCKLSQAVTGVSRLNVVFAGAMHLNWLKFQGEHAIGDRRYGWWRSDERWHGRQRGWRREW